MTQSIFCGQVSEELKSCPKIFFSGKQKVLSALKICKKKRKNFKMHIKVEIEIINLNRWPFFTNTTRFRTCV